MKLSVSLPDEDVAVLDEHARRTGLRSRSAAIHQAVRMLRRSGLEEDYAAAWEDWVRSRERDEWEAATGDGLLMRRGEIRLVDLDPVPGNEADKRRPAIVVSNDRANSVAERLGRGVVTVVPLTSNTTRVFPFQVLVGAGQAGLRVDAKAQAEQVRSVAVERLGPAVGRMPAPLMAEIDEALRLHLDL